MSLAQVTVTPLRRIATPGGDVMHAMKAGDEGYAGFGEAYFSWVEAGAVKAWKQHTRMTLNLIVPVGLVRFVFSADETGRDMRIEEIGEIGESGESGAGRYARLTVPPGIWFGFQGLAAPASLVLNLADTAHDPAEVLRREVAAIPFEWQGVQ